ncbi:MAG: MCE family protein, partial [Nocardioides sp.]|nr:MCE family protein [Nocardioides sp.]
MTRGIKVRLVLFVVLAAVGIVYVAGAYLGVVDRVLSRGLAVHATLPESGGLFVGSEVTYRGVKVGKVSAMNVTPEGMRADLALREGTRIPVDSSIHVHNLSAVGEQYLDIQPATAEGPYLAEGDTLVGGPDSLPVDEGDLLVDLDELVGSLDGEDLNTVISELGTTFRGTSTPLQRMVDGGQRFLEEAIAHEDVTFALLDNGRVVLRTQARHGDNIRTFARDLADLTGTLRKRDREVRVVLEGGAAAVREVDGLLTDLEPTLPVFLGDLVTLNQISTARIDGI